MIKVIVLISGNGSNLQALIEDAATSSNYQISAVISNKVDAYGLIRAKNANINTYVIKHENEIIKIIHKGSPDLICLAGYMRILSKEFIQKVAVPILNIHPSLLPKHKGLHTHQRAIEAGDKEHGATVHYVTEELDGGPIIAQVRVPVFSTDDSHTLAQRVLKAEHSLYPEVVRSFAQNRLKCDHEKTNVSA